MTSQKPKPVKKAHELTTKEAIESLFHPHVVRHAKEHAREAEAKGPKSGKASMP